MQGGEEGEQKPGGHGEDKTGGILNAEAQLRKCAGALRGDAKKEQGGGFMSLRGIEWRCEACHDPEAIS
jgi:hypothetical protein